MPNRNSTNKGNTSASVLFPWTLPELEPQTALGKKNIASHFPGPFGRLRLPTLAQLLGSEDAVLKVRAIEKAGRLPEEPALVLALSTGSSSRSRRLALGLPMHAARQLVDRISGRDGKAGTITLSTGELGILTYALDRAAGDWMRVGGTQFYVRGSLYGVDQIPDYLGSDPQFLVSARFVEAGLNFPAHLWIASADRPHLHLSRPIASSTRRWPVTIRVQIGTTNIPAAQLEDLGAGDLIICDEIGHPSHDKAPASCTLRCGAWRKNASWKDRSTLIIDETDEGKSMQNQGPTELTATLSPPTKPREGDLEVEVSVEIGRLRLSVQQATGLMAGAVLKLDKDIGSEVSLVVGDRSIASGRLVAYEDRLAVELTEVTS